MTHVLVVDVGSLSVRAAICDGSARIVAETAEAYSFTVAADGTSEVDARRLQGMVERCVDRILTNAAPIEAFAAVLLQLNVRYKTRVAVRFTGLDDQF